MLQRKPYIHLRCSPGASAAELATGFDSVPYGAATWRFRKGATFLGTVASQSSRQMAREPVLRVWAVEAHGVRGGGVTGASATKMSMVMGGRRAEGGKRRRCFDELSMTAFGGGRRGRRGRRTGGARVQPGTAAAGPAALQMTRVGAKPVGRSRPTIRRGETRRQSGAATRTVGIDDGWKADARPSERVRKSKWRNNLGDNISAACIAHVWENRGRGGPRVGHRRRRYRWWAGRFHRPWYVTWNRF